MKKAVIVTHAEDDRNTRKKNPRHTREGRTNYRDTTNGLYLLSGRCQWMFDFRVVWFGGADRFREMGVCGLADFADFRQLPRFHCDALGDAGYLDDLTDMYVSPMGRDIPKKQHVSLRKVFPPTYWWEDFLEGTVFGLLEELGLGDSDALLLAGRTFLRRLGAVKQSFRNSVFVADIHSKTIERIIKNGVYLREPESIPVDLRDRRKDELRELKQAYRAHLYRSPW
jgi:hypothetical protein